MKTTLGVTLAASAGVAAMVFAPQAGAEAFLVCPSGVSGVATSVTSCAFADNVRAAYHQQGAGSVVAYSPVTGRWYDMWCEPGYVSELNAWPWSVSSVRCSGGNNAVVVAW